MVEKTIIPEEKLAKILDAAQKRFARYGLQKTTMSEVADDLGISKAALYYYFPDKENIFKDVVLKEQTDFCLHMNKVIASGDNISSILNNYIEKRIEYLKRLLNLGQLNFEAFHASRPLFAELGKIFFEREQTLISNALESALRNKEIAKIDVEEYAAFFVRTLCALRIFALEKRESWDNGDIDKKIKKEYQLFTKIFLQSIVKNEA